MFGLMFLWDRPTRRLGPDLWAMYMPLAQQLINNAVVWVRKLIAAPSCFVLRTPYHSPSSAFLWMLPILTQIADRKIRRLKCLLSPFIYPISVFLYVGLFIKWESGPLHIKCSDGRSKWTTITFLRTNVSSIDLFSICCEVRKRTQLSVLTVIWSFSTI